MPQANTSLRGQLILDGGKLQGSFFHRSVVLICQHDADGAFGLMLNRPTNSKVGEALVANLSKGVKDQPMFIGGPVQPQGLSFLHSDDYLPCANVMTNLNLDHSLDALVELSESFSSTRKLKLFAGYAGWSAGQLEHEMSRRDWLVHPATLKLVFDVLPEQLWKSIMRQKGVKSRLLADSPDDLSWN